jgi:hypothetical protein
MLAFPSLDCQGNPGPEWRLTVAIYHDEAGVISSSD